MEELSQSLEDYLEAILLISRNKRIVRVKDLASHLDVRTASVIGALKKLSEKGLVDHEHYGYVALTVNGEEIAACIHDKHLILFRFLSEYLQVGQEIAERDACRIEHHVSSETLNGILKLIRVLESYPEDIRLKMASASV